CESGSGTLGTVDLSTGSYEAVAAVPGFTRGIDIVGDLAFVGLSQVRESAVFSGIPITERLAPEQRTCGVCVVDLRRGEVVALLKFTSGVQEVFAVALLPRRWPDLINEDEKVLESSFVVPAECLGEVAATVRAAGPACLPGPSRQPAGGGAGFRPGSSWLREVPMSMRSWVRDVSARPVTRPIRKAPPRARLGVEGLEDRTVPSTFTVVNTLDDGSEGSLRWAVGQANSTAGADTINFDRSVFSTPQTITLAGSQLELTDTTGA